MDTRRGGRSAVLGCVAAVALAVASTSLAGCGALVRAREHDSERLPDPVVVAREASAKTTHNVVLVTIDGARWQEIFHGVDPDLAKEARFTASEYLTPEQLFPTMYGRIIPGGVAEGAPGYAAPMLASGPNFVSLPGYLEIFLGHASGCRSNRCEPTRERTIADDVRDMPGVSTDDVAVISSWEAIARAATRDPSHIVVSAGRHEGATRDHVSVDAVSAAVLARSEAAGPSPGEDDYRPDRFTAELSLRYLEAKRPRFLFVGLGDPDEHAHHRDYRAYLGSLRAADGFLGELLATLDRLGDYGAATSVIVTCDHGRARDFQNHGGDAPESARVWMLAYGGSIQPQGYATSAAPRRLADVAPSIRALLGVESDGSPGAGRPIASLFTPPESGSRQASR